MSQNVCRFIPNPKEGHNLHLINFVLETEKQPYEALLSQALYKAHYVKSGSGILHMQQGAYPLCAGDVFFTFPSVPFCIESVEDFTYMYISFLGSRGNQIMESLGICASQCLFHDCDALCAHWLRGLGGRMETAALLAESILLDTFAYLGDRLFAADANAYTEDTLAVRIKRILDENLSDPTLSLNKIASSLSYSPKYISTVFKRAFGIGVSEYLNVIRLQHATTLFRQGFSVVSDVAARSGYADAQYFSKLFKSSLGFSPREYVRRFRSGENL